MVVVVVAVMGPCEGFLEWLSWNNAEQDLCDGLCQCPKDLVLAAQHGIDCVDCNITYIQGERERGSDSPLSLLFLFYITVDSSRPKAIEK